MLEARSLIQQKRYPEARTILKAVDHPTASAWVEKLDAIADRQAGVTKEFKNWQASQQVTATEGVRHLPGVSQDDLDFLASVHARFIEEALQDAQARIKQNPKILKFMYPESNLTPALELGAEVYAMSALVSVQMESAETMWQTVISLAEELAEVRASLGVRCIQKLVTK
jgi:hypothetical protein